MQLCKWCSKLQLFLAHKTWWASTDLVGDYLHTRNGSCSERGIARLLILGPGHSCSEYCLAPLSDPSSSQEGPSCYPRQTALPLHHTDAPDPSCLSQLFGVTLTILQTQPLLSPPLFSHGSKACVLMPPGWPPTILHTERVLGPESLLMLFPRLGPSHLFISPTSS